MSALLSSVPLQVFQVCDQEMKTPKGIHNLRKLLSAFANAGEELFASASAKKCTVLPSLSCATLVEVAPSKFGGLGLMARRNFEAGDVILVEAPFLSVRSGMLTKTLHCDPLGIGLTINLLAFHRCLKLSGRISRTPSAIPRPPPHTSANLSQSSIPPVGVYVYVSESSLTPRPSPLFYNS